MTDLVALSAMVCPSKNREDTEAAPISSAGSIFGWIRLISTHSAVGTWMEIHGDPAGRRVVFFVVRSDSPTSPTGPRGAML